MDIYTVIEFIDNHIESFNDGNLYDVSKILINLIYDDDEIEEAASYVVNHLAKKGKNTGLKADNGFDVELNDMLHQKYVNLLLSVVEQIENLTLSINIRNFDYWDLFKMFPEQKEILKEKGYSPPKEDDAVQKRRGSNNLQTEPQQGTTRQGKTTDNENKYFAKAIEEGLMVKTDSGYRWLHNNGMKASLGYFLKCVFDPKGTERIPFKSLEALFGVARLDTVIRQVLDAKNNQKWRKDIDILFED